jgi:uncharacterized protein with LGFP repeats
MRHFEVVAPKTAGSVCMTTQRNPFRRAVGRLAVGLIAAATALALLAPIASADPQSDADDAITAAWTAAGGDTSPLGTKDGGVYPVGAGFGQNFASGAIYFTPATGARAMYGAILDKYRDLGGPADSDLGFPNIDEGPGKVSADSRNTTFSAGDDPVIFWTPDTGAWVVRGPINAAWDKLGGSAGTLGVPTADETYSGSVITQTFTGGQVSYDLDSKQFTTVPPDLADQLTDLPVPTDATSAINTAWRVAGGASGPLGLRQGDQKTVGAGAEQDFAGGDIYFSPDTGAHVVSGAILTEYESLGGPTGDFGFPSAGEADGGVPGSRVSAFAGAGGAVIFWTADHGAIPVRGAMKAAWDKLGGAAGALGVPVADQNTNGDTVTQKFSGGQVSYDSKNNTFSTDPKNLADQLTGLQVPPQSVTPPSVPAAPASDAKSHTGFQWQNWWLWWIVPLAVLLLASVAAFAVILRRRSAGGADDDFGDEDETDYRGVPPDQEHWESSEDDEPSTSRVRFVDPDAENSAYASSGRGWPDHDVADAPERRWGDLPSDTGRGPSMFTPHGAHESEDLVAIDINPVEEEDPDSVDTAPTRVQDDEREHSGRHAALNPDTGKSIWTAPDDDSYLPGPQSLFAPVYGAVPPPPEPEDTDSTAEVMEPDIGDHAVAPPAIHLPLEDPHEAPAGYPIKGSMRSGSYYTPDSSAYDQTVAEIWFATEELAQANGFSKAD